LEFKNGTPFKPKFMPYFDAKLYPNPFTHNIYIELGDKDLAYETFKIEMYNHYGSLVFSDEVIGYNSKLEISPVNLLPGLYLIRIFPLSNSSRGIGNLKAVKLN